MISTRFFVWTVSIAVLATLITPNAYGQTWDGDAADGLWNSPTNWDTNNVPVLGGVTNIGSASVPSPTVTLSGSAGAVGQLYIGNNNLANAELIINGVNLNADNQVQVGKVTGATGILSLINGGTITNGSQVGAGSASGATGIINMATGTQITAGTVVGGQFGNGSGAKYTVNMAGTALFLSNGDLATRSNVAATGDWTGAGTIQASSGIVYADARFTADGGTLTIRPGQYQRIWAIAQGDTGTALDYEAGIGGKKSGWYAINGGTLVLEGNGAWGPLGSSNQTLPYTYGDQLSGNLATQLAVNSVNFMNLTNVTDPANVLVEIQDPTTIMGLTGVVSAYNFNNLDDFDTNATGIQARFRYDDFGLSSLDEPNLKLFQDLGSGWTELTGFTLDTVNKWITSPNLVYADGGMGDMGLFAVAQDIATNVIPEPSTYALALLGLAGLGLVAWKRRRLHG